MTDASKPTRFEQTCISMIVDRSGSMQSCQGAAIAAINSYLAEARKDSVLAEADFDLTIFDSNSIDSIRSGAPLRVADITQDDFQPRASTPLYDAVGRGIESLDKRLTASASTKAVLVIVTDGQENSSKKHTHESISALIKDRQDKGWLVLFLASGLGNAQQGLAMGIRAESVANIGLDRASLSASMSYASRASSGYGRNPNAVQAKAWRATGAAGLSAGERRLMGDTSGGEGLVEIRRGDPVKTLNTGYVTPQEPPDVWEKGVDQDAWGG